METYVGQPGTFEERGGDANALRDRMTLRRLHEEAHECAALYLDGKPTGYIVRVGDLPEEIILEAALESVKAGINTTLRRCNSASEQVASSLPTARNYWVRRATPSPPSWTASDTAASATCAVTLSHSPPEPQSP